MKIKLINLLSEEITSKINNINKSGSKVLNQAKIKKLEDEINIINQIKQGIPVNIKDYVDPEKISDIMGDLDKDIEELQEEIKLLSTD